MTRLSTPTDEMATQFRSTAGVRWAASAVIVVAVALQLTTFKSGKPGKFTWPFLRYCMYNNCYQPGPIETTSRELIAVTAAGAEVPADRASMGMDYYALHRFYVRPFLKGDRSKLNELAAKMNEIRDDPVVAVKINTTTHVLTDTGHETRQSTETIDVTSP